MNETIKYVRNAPNQKQMFTLTPRKISEIVDVDSFQVRNHKFIMFVEQTNFVGKFVIPKGQNQTGEIKYINTKNTIFFNTSLILQRGIMTTVMKNY